MNNSKDIIDLTQDEIIDLTQDSDEGENSNSRAPLPDSRPGAGPIRTNSTRSRWRFSWPKLPRNLMTPKGYRAPVENDLFTPQQPVHKCGGCMNTFSGRELLHEHLRDVHNRDPLAWLPIPIPMRDRITCPLGCPEEFLNQLVLDRHMIDAHGHKDPNVDDDSEFVNGREQKDRTGQVRKPPSYYAKMNKKAKK